MANAVIVVDMIVAFMEKGRSLYCGDRARTIIPRVQEILDREVARGSHIFFLMDAHKPDDKEFQMFPPHAIAGTDESQLIPELAGYPGDRIPKTRYSGFFRTDLEKRLKALKPDKVIVVGVCTNICVLHTVADLRNRDYRVEVPADAVASFSDEAHEWALKHMKEVLGATIV